MLEPLKGLPSGIAGIRGVGTVSREDYESVLEPILDDARKEGRRIRFVYELGPDFDRFTPGAAWEDMKVGLGTMRLFDGCAMVSDIAWLREASGFVGFFMPCPVRAFGAKDLDGAVAWLQSLPEGPGVTHRLLPDSGVLTVEVDGALRTPDFDALAATADPWIESHGKLQGLVIHARKFPGWENFGSVLRHLRFVRDHHRKVRRVAFAADSELATLSTRVAEHFVEAEVKTFGYDALDDAITWATGNANDKAGVTGPAPSAEHAPR